MKKYSEYSDYGEGPVHRKDSLAEYVRIRQKANSKDVPKKKEPSLLSKALFRGWAGPDLSNNSWTLRHVTS